MPVGIAEVKAGSAEFPIDAALYGYTLFAEPLLPRLQLAAIDGKGKMQRPAAIVRRYDPARSLNRLVSAALEEQKKEMSPGDTQSAKTLVTFN